MSVTIKDVSQTSGISIATVSKYLNGVAVRPRSAEKIARAIEELGYHPNPIARSLRNSCTMTIGVFVDNITNNFYNNIVALLTRQLREHGYSCLICDVDNSAKTIADSVSFFASKKVDGVFVITNHLPAEVIPLFNRTFRNIVVIDCFVPGLQADFVFTDNLSAAYLSTEQFIARNHKRIAIITGHPDVFSAHERLNGYLRALQDYQIDSDPELIFQYDYDMNGGYCAFRKLSELPAERRPSAVLVTSYFMTVGAVIALNELGLTIPADLSMICFDNYDINKVFRPLLSCVIQPVDSLCTRATELLLERIGGDVQENRILRLNASFQLGESLGSCT